MWQVALKKCRKFQGERAREKRTTKLQNSNTFDISKQQKVRNNLVKNQASNKKTHKSRVYELQS